MNGNGTSNGTGNGGMNRDGLIGKINAWLFQPLEYGDNDPVNWFAFVILFYLAGLLWSKVVRQVIEGI